MKTTDLRIGNLVSYKNEDIVVVDAVSKDFILTHGQFKISTPNIEPIPLTEQWLLDLGLNQNIGKQWYVHFDGMCLTLYKDSEQYMVQIHDMEIDESSIFLKSIQYVHQIQNLYFALTEEELILKERSKQ